jgi:hypothetical protein
MLLGEFMVINIIKGVVALFLVCVICYTASIALMVATDKSAGPDFAVAFAWIGTVPALFYIQNGFGRRFVAALLGSAASIACRVGLGLLTGALLSTGLLTESQALLFIFGPFAVIVNIGQLVVAYFVARAAVKWGTKKRLKLAAA